MKENINNMRKLYSEEKKGRQSVSKKPPLIAGNLGASIKYHNSGDEHEGLRGGISLSNLSPEHQRRDIVARPPHLQWF